MFGSAFPAERCLAVVTDVRCNGSNEGIAFTDSAFYSTLDDVSQISYADIEDIEDVSSLYDKKYILTAKNGKKIKVKYSKDSRLEKALECNLGKLLQALAKEGKKNPNVARIKIVANKMTMEWKIFWMVVLSLIAFVIFKCTH